MLRKQALFETIEDDPLYPVVKITALYGLRRSEVLGLKWDSVDFTTGRLTIKRSPKRRAYIPLKFWESALIWLHISSFNIQPANNYMIPLKNCSYSFSALLLTIASKSRYARSSLLPFSVRTVPEPEAPPLLRCTRAKSSSASA